MKYSIISLLFLLSFCCGASKSGAGINAANPTTADAPRERMRNFVQQISAYAKKIDPKFVIIPQNAHDIVTDHSDPTEMPNRSYLEAIDGIGREDLFYGYENDDEKTETNVTEEIVAFLNIYRDNGIKVLVTDYAAAEEKMVHSYSANAALGFASFCADRRDLDNIPRYPARPNRENSSDITDLGQVENFLYILDPGNTNFFSDKGAYLSKLRSTNFDLFIIDAFYEGAMLTFDQVQGLKQKANGRKRMVVAYMSIGEAENYRYYWQSIWNSKPPSWVRAENADFEGNFIVEYWQPEWQAIIFGDDTSYLSKIMNAGFDGVYLDIVDAFEFFEE